MQYQGAVIAVRSMEVSKAFYQEVLHQKLIMDFGVNVTFERGLSLQEGFAGMMNVPEDSMTFRPHVMELYFEEEQFDDTVAELKRNADIQWIHEVKEYPWGQRVVRFYDPDGHMLEIGESMKTVIVRFLQQGMTVEQVASRSMYPVPFIEQCKQELQQNG